MKSTDYLDAVKRRHSLESDYQLAKVLGVGHSTISHYRNGRSIMDVTMCIKVAELLAAPPLEIIAAAEIERAKRPEVKKVWLRYAAAVVLGTVSLAGAPTPGQAAFNNNLMGTQAEVHICEQRRRKRRARLPGRAAAALSALGRYARASALAVAL